MTMTMSLGLEMTSYSLMMCGWRKRDRYWISRWTRFDISAVEILRLLMNFMATLRPVLTCRATEKTEACVSALSYPPSAILRVQEEVDVRLTFPNEPVPSVAAAGEIEGRSVPAYSSLAGGQLGMRVCFWSRWCGPWTGGHLVGREQRRSPLWQLEAAELD